MDRTAFLKIKTEKATRKVIRKALKKKHRKFCKRRYLSRMKKTQRKKTRTILLPEKLVVHEDKMALDLINALNAAMGDKTIQLDFTAVEIISLRVGLLLKAFSDEYMERHKEKPLFRCPAIDEKTRKTQAILKFLGIRDYQIQKGKHYKDLDCWRILTFEKSREENIPKLLSEDIIPKCLGSRNEETNGPIATAISEVLFNCREHAYNDKSTFQKWYLGYGRYPGTSSFQFCVCDKGVGFRKSMQLHFREDQKFNDTEIIAEAAKGRTGVLNGSNKGRGQGLKTAIQNLTQVKGSMEIMSGNGRYRAGINSKGEYVETLLPPREIGLTGSLIDFSIPD